jgi:hypothetical protein
MEQLSSKIRDRNALTYTNLPLLQPVLELVGARLNHVKITAQNSMAHRARKTQLLKNNSSDAAEIIIELIFSITLSPLSSATPPVVSRDAL